MATHALALASTRHVVAYDRDIRAGTWHYLSAGGIRRATSSRSASSGSGGSGSGWRTSAATCSDACSPAIRTSSTATFRRTSPLLAHPRVILTPHAAFFSLQAERELREKAARNIVTWLETGRPDYVVTAGTRALQDHAGPISRGTGQPKRG